MITTEPNYNALVVVDHALFTKHYQWFLNKARYNNDHRNQDMNMAMYLRVVEGAINVIISMLHDLPPTAALRIVEYFEDHELGDLEDHELMAFEQHILSLIPLFPDEVKAVKYLMRKDKLQYWYATTDLNLSLEFDGVMQ